MPRVHRRGHKLREAPSDISQMTDEQLKAEMNRLDAEHMERREAGRMDAEYDADGADYDRFTELLNEQIRRQRAARKANT